MSLKFPTKPIPGIESETGARPRGVKEETVIE